jgi:hypothetical protein
MYLSFALYHSSERFAFFLRYRAMNPARQSEWFMAERQGFEPWVPVKALLLSKQVR